MAYELISSGSLLDIAELSSYESYIAEEQRAMLELDLRLPVSANVAQTLEDQLKARGIPEVRVATASPMLRVYWQKGFPWLAVIAAAILGLIVLAVVIMGWRLFKEIVPEGLQPLVGGLGLTLLLILGIAILARRRK